MDDGSGARLDHRRGKRAVEPDGGHQVDRQVGLPVGVVEGERPRGPEGLCASVGDEDVDAPEDLERLPGEGRRSGRGGEVGGNEGEPAVR